MRGWPIYTDLLPSCNARCPAGENIQAWLAATRAGQHERAWRELVADNPLPAIYGGVCYHQPGTGRDDALWHLSKHVDIPARDASRITVRALFDGFRTSHEVNTIDLLSDDDLRALVPEELIRTHRSRALSPDHPVIRGTAQNPDVGLFPPAARAPEDGHVMFEFPRGDLRPYRISPDQHMFA